MKQNDNTKWRYRRVPTATLQGGFGGIGCRPESGCDQCASLCHQRVNLQELEDYDQATENLEIAKQGSYGSRQQWVPLLVNLTYGDVFHAQASNAIRSGDWERAESYQETSLEFFSNVINASSGNLGVVTDGDELGVTMQDMYVSAQGRWQPRNTRWRLLPKY